MFCVHRAFLNEDELRGVLLSLLTSHAVFPPVHTTRLMMLSAANSDLSVVLMFCHCRYNPVTRVNVNGAHFCKTTDDFKLNVSSWYNFTFVSALWL